MRSPLLIVDLTSSPHASPESGEGCAIAEARSGGFSLVELLVVIALMAVIMGLVIPALKTGDSFGNSAYEIEEELEQARAYAMANNTHVFVGIGEYDSSVSASAVSQVPSDAGGKKGGRIAVAIVASRDGTSGRSAYSPDSWVSATYGTGQGLLAVSKVKVYENLHLADLNHNAPPPQSGPMARLLTESAFSLGSADCVSVTPFTYPLGSKLTPPYQYYFSKVVEFDPRGAAIIASKTGNSGAQMIEIGLQPSHGSVVAAAPSNQNIGNHAALQIDGLTGKTRIYRP